MILVKKIALLGVTAIATTALFVSFTSKPDDDKKKKYQVIHHSNGSMIIHDTIIPMNSTYSVENFLADKGIENKNVEIIQMPSMGDMEHSGNRMMIHEFSEDVNGENSEKVEIRVEMDDDGNRTMKKIVNGEEVELTDEDLEMIKKHKMEGGHHGMMKLDLLGDPESGEVQIQVEIDDDGNKTIKKTVNGEEVELTEEELEMIEEHKGKGHHARMMKMHGDHGSENVEIRVEIDDDGKKTIKKTVNGEEVEMTEEEMENMEIHHMGGHHGENVMIIMDKDMEESGDGEHKVIIKKMRVEHEGAENLDLDMEMDFEWISENGEGNVMMMDGEEEFTVVIVMENYDENMEGKRKIKINTSKDDVEVYPNPSDGTFTIRFSQSEKVKTTIKVTDSKGKVVFEDKLGKFKGEYNEQIDLKKFGSGTYIIAIEAGNNVEKTKVIVK